MIRNCLIINVMFIQNDILWVYYLDKKSFMILVDCSDKRLVTEMLNTFRKNVIKKRTLITFARLCRGVSAFCLGCVV